MTNIIRLPTRRRAAKRTPDSYVSPETRLTICVALREDYRRCMEHLNLADPSETATFLLLEAAKAWEAYREFTGMPMHRSPD